MQYDDDDELITPQIQSTAGQLLREARLNHELTIEAVADELRLSTQLISDLENNTPDPRYKPTFIRGYLRAYARYVGLSPALVVELYEGQQKGVPPEENIKRSLPLAQRTDEATRHLSQFLKGLMGGAYKQRKPAVVLSLALVGVVFMLQPSGQKSAHLMASDTEAVSTIAQRLETPQPKQPITVKAQAIQSKPVEQAKANENLAVLKVEFIDTCWITVFDGNHKSLATGIRDSKTPLVIEGKPPLRVMLGNPKVAYLNFNGEDVDLDVPVKDEMVNLTLG